MKIERTENAARNIVYGGVLKVYMLLIPFVMRTLMIYFLGVQYLGLSSLFNSILQVLNLAELGVGSAMVYSMYKPIAEDNHAMICSLMKLYRKYYRIIGLVIAVLGMVLLPFIPRLITEDSLMNLPGDVNIYVLYLLNLFTTVMTYWLFAYRNCLLNAYQRNDIISKISMGIVTLQYALQIFAICFMKSYYAYLIIALITQIATNLVTAAVTRKLFPDYKPVGEISKQESARINQRIKDLFTSKIGGVVAYSVDSIVISAFLGLTILAMYQNYYYILTSVTGILGVLTASCTAGLGNSFVVETKEKNYRDLRILTFLISWLWCICICCFLNLYQPFMKLWVGEDLMFPFLMVVLLCVYFYFFELNAFLSVFKDAAGRWHEDRFRPLIVAATNLCLNLIMVQFWGIYGVIASTFIAQMLISIPWLCKNLFSTVYEMENLKGYFVQLVKFAVSTIVIAAVMFFICKYIEFDSALLTFLIRLVINALVPNVFLFLFYRNMPELKDSAQLMERAVKKLLHRK